MQLVLSRLFEARKSSADGKISALKPMECMKPLRASRTDSSSSTMETTGVLELTSRIARPVSPESERSCQSTPRGGNPRVSAGQFCDKNAAAINVCLAVLRREHPPSFTVWQSSATVVILLTMLLFQFLLLDLPRGPHHMAHKSR